ncbi:MAG: M3 family oligoendopeptidase [Treponemataceae bacterium]
MNGSDNAGGTLPRWNLGPLYASFDAPEYARDRELLAELSAQLLVELDTPFPQETSAAGVRVKRVLVLLEKAGDLAENVGAYAYAVYSTDTRNASALAAINAAEERALPLERAAVLFRTRLTEIAHLVPALVEDGSFAPYAFFFAEQIELASKQMSGELEDLAADLARTGADAWSRLHEAVSSTASSPWPRDGAEGRKTVVALRSLAFDSDRSVRADAFRAELDAWKAAEIPIAAALNGVKGSYLIVNTRRGWRDALEKSAYQARISVQTLDSLIASLEESLPVFRRYLKAKARLLGVPACAFYDLFAPVGETGRKWSYDQSRAFIIDRFSAFDSGMGAFAGHAFDASWIDAEPREGKVGGAYCMDFPIKGDSRILCNYEGSFSSLTTLAHELGHAWHHEQLKDLPRTLSAYPMTLAETASIFAETVVFESALSECRGRNAAGELLGLLEINLQDSCQVIVDILSRFYFERSVFARRASGELSPADFCSLMVDAQKATYGDAVDPQALHPYMWAVKGHYYSGDLAFYNFPYAFGLLFGLGLYARYEKEGAAFATDYRALLRMTGSAGAVDVGRKAGFDMENIDFWRSGISVIAARVEEFERLCGQVQQ